MTKVGKSLVESTSEALAYAKGEADDTKYGVTVPEQDDVKLGIEMDLRGWAA